MAVYVFKGRANGVEEVAWSTTYHPGCEPRLLSAPSVKVGCAATVGGIHKPSLTLEVDNADGALDALFLGRRPGRLRDWTGPSLAEWRGALWLVREGTELAITPTLAVAAAVEAAPGRLSLSLTAESPFLAATKPPRTIADWLSQPGLAIEKKARMAEEETDAELMARLQRYSSSELRCPLLYGRATIRLTAIDTDSRWWLAGEVDLATASIIHLGTQVILGPTGRGLSYLSRSTPQFLLLSAPGVPDRRLLLFHRLSASGTVPDPIYTTLRRKAESPITVLRQVLKDATGQEAFYLPPPRPVGEPPRPGDLPKQRHLLGAVAGEVATEASLEAIIESIAAPMGMDIYIGTDNKLRALAPPADADLAEITEASPIGRIDAEEVLPEEDSTPATSAVVTLGTLDFGSPATAVGIDWPQDLRDLYQHRLHEVDLPALRPYPESELRIPGDWLAPAEAIRVLSGVRNRTAVPVRLVRLAVSYAYAHWQPGALCLFRTIGIPGRELRVGQLRMKEYAGEDGCIYLTVADYGAVGSHRIGKLDSMENWLLYRSPPGAGFDLIGSRIYLPPTLAQPSRVGCTLWVPGATDPRNRRSYEILDFGSDGGGTFAEVTPSVAATEIGLQGEGAVLLMLNQTHSPSWRPDYIRGAKVDTGLFRDGTEGFDFAP